MKTESKTQNGNKPESRCVACGATRGRFCPMSIDGEGPHEFAEFQPQPTFAATPSGHLPGGDNE